MSDSIIIDDLRKEEEKYRLAYDSKFQNWVLERLKAEAFRLALQKIRSKGLIETYTFFKSKRDEHQNCTDSLSRNLANAYNLVVGKLWKYRKIIKK